MRWMSDDRPEGFLFSLVTGIIAAIIAIVLICLGISIVQRIFG